VSLKVSAILVGVVVAGRLAFEAVSVLSNQCETVSDFDVDQCEVAIALGSYLLRT
jgi:hypothetical protein